MKDTFILLLTIVTASLIVYSFLLLLGHAVAYQDKWKESLMTSCESNGYSWGECYNVIHGDKSAFDK